MIIRGDISHESGTWLNVDFIVAVRGGREDREKGGGEPRMVRKISRNYQKALREGTLGEVVN